MSLKAKLDNAYNLGTLAERARVLWLMDEERKWLRKKLQGVLLVEDQRHAMQVKVKLATAIFEQLKMRMMADHQPPFQKEEQDNAENHEGPG